MTDEFPQQKRVEARRLAKEAIATLVNIKRIAADRLLRPAGVPNELIQRFLKGRDATTVRPKISTATLACIQHRVR